MATSYCWNTSRHCKGIHSLSFQNLFYMIPTPIMVVSFAHNWYNFVKKGKAHFFRTTCNPRWMRRKLHNYVHIKNCLFYTVQTISFKTYNDIYYQFVATLILWLLNYWIAGQCYVSNPPHHPIAVIWRVWSMWQVLPPWHEPNMMHVRLLFLQPDLYDVHIHSCSPLFVGDLNELQHFIQSVECIEWGKSRWKAPRVFIFGSTMLIT